MGEGGGGGGGGARVFRWDEPTLSDISFPLQVLLCVWSPRQYQGVEISGWKLPAEFLRTSGHCQHCGHQF